MDEWATASANPAVALQGLSGTQAAATFKAGLQAIQKSYITCNIDVPKATAAGTAVDYTKVNVDYINGSNADTPLVKDPGCTKTNTSTTMTQPRQKSCCARQRVPWSRLIQTGGFRRFSVATRGYKSFDVVESTLVLSGSHLGAFSGRSVRRGCRAGRGLAIE